jgi:hypothetical protein
MCRLYVDSEPCEPRCADRNEEGFDGFDALCEVVRPFPNQLGARQIVDPHEEDDTGVLRAIRGGAS